MDSGVSPRLERRFRARSLTGAFLILLLMIWYLRRQDPLDDVGNLRGRAGAGMLFQAQHELWRHQDAEPLVGAFHNKGEAFVKDFLHFNWGEAALAAYDLHCGAEAIMPRHRLISGWS